MDTGRQHIIAPPPPPSATPRPPLLATAQGQLRVWIDQDLCTGDGICTDHAPAVFTILEDGIAYCQEEGQVLNDPGGAAQMALVTVADEDEVVHAAGDCPGECIFIEFDEPDGLHL